MEKESRFFRRLPLRPFRCLSAWLALLIVSSVLWAQPTPAPVLPELSDLEFWTFEQFAGHGAMELKEPGAVPFLEINSIGDEGMAAEVRSRKIPVEPNRRYIVTLERRTEGLETVNAELTGGPYVQFWDEELLPGSYQPLGSIAPANADWHSITIEFVVPSTARWVDLHLAFAAYGGYEQGLRPRVSGRARGQVAFRNVELHAEGRIKILPASVRVADQTVQAGIETVFESLHNASLLGLFRDSDGYYESSNIVPDLSFGLFGIRRQGNPEYLGIIQRQWQELGLSASEEGELPQRVMSQVLYPLGVDEIFSFTGDVEFLKRFLPIADRALDYVHERADSNGLVRLVEYGQWQIGQGADWVDWYPTRMEGKTFNFHQWYVRALRRCAALHQEFGQNAAGSFASLDRAREYLIRADQVEKSLRRLYWAGDHFVTNIDYGGRIADEKWLDDHVWAIMLGTATAEQAEKIWSWIDEDPFEREGVPTSWAAFAGPVHGRLTWFGRLGAGDILARYHTGQGEHGAKLLRRISEIFARDRNVYEAYTMYGTIAPGTLGWGNYTEHCGGFLWALTEGPFGVSFESDEEAVATVRPWFPRGWSSGEAGLVLRGTRIDVAYSWSQGNLSLNLKGEGEPQRIRIVMRSGETKIVSIGSGTDATIVF